jgi:hypothetical protein
MMPSLSKSRSPLRQMVSRISKAPRKAKATLSSPIRSFRRRVREIDEGDGSISSFGDVFPHLPEMDFGTTLPFEGVPWTGSLVEEAMEQPRSIHTQTVFGSIDPASPRSVNPMWTREDVEFNKSSIQGTLRLFDSEDTKIRRVWMPAVVHETIVRQIHEIREERITREIHHHHVFHRTLNVHDVEVLPARHFLRSWTDDKLREIPAGVIRSADDAFQGRFDSAFNAA